MKNYTEGYNMKSLEHIPQISSYNYNYYKGIGTDLLLGISDDDNTTEWYISQYERWDEIGCSYCSEGEILHLKNITS